MTTSSLQGAPLSLWLAPCEPCVRVAAGALLPGWAPLLQPQACTRAHPRRETGRVRAWEVPCKEPCGLRSRRDHGESWGFLSMRKVRPAVEGRATLAPAPWRRPVGGPSPHHWVGAARCRRRVPQEPPAAPAAALADGQQACTLAVPPSTAGSRAGAGDAGQLSGTGLLTPAGRASQVSAVSDAAAVLRHSEPPG